MRRRELLLLAAAGSFGAWWLLRTPAADPEADSTTASMTTPTATVTHRSSGAAPLLADQPTSQLETTPRYPSEPPEQAYLDDRVMLRVEDDSSLLAIARDHGARVDRLPGPSGYGSLLLPEGTDRHPFLAQLRDDPRVGRASPVGVIHGAESKGGDSSSTRTTDFVYSWHLDAMQHPDDGETISDVVVAVLDTGVAYESHSDANGSYVQAASLASTSIVAPWDFVNEDAHANDDHQHGTHIATSIAGQHVVEGVAPGAAIMPLKVLDADNAGTELYLIDAIWHAVDNGADVINMSLSFGGDYYPSAALNEALEAAWDAGIVLVAASGNEGESWVSFPAAHRRVLAVGAVRATSTDGSTTPASYSNASPRIDVLAPGGDLDNDINGDGYPDGILAESIDYQDPTTTAYWLYAGTSQAAALVSGAVARLLHEGATPEECITSLQTASAASLKHIWYGWGTGNIDLSDGILYVDKHLQLPEYYVAVMPYLEAYGSSYVRPKAELTLLDEDGDPVAGVDLMGTISGSEQSTFYCSTDSDGTCTATGGWTAAYDGRSPAALAYVFRVEAAWLGYISVHPGSAFFASDALEILLTALDNEGSGIATSPLGFHWPSGADPDLGVDLAESYVFVDMGTGIATSPLGVVITPPVIEPHIVQDETLSLDLDGTGIATSPLGVVPISRITLGGSGIATSPLGIIRIPIVIIGNGIATSPLGLNPPPIIGPPVMGGNSFDSTLLDLDGVPVLNGAGEVEGTAIEAGLDDGGWVVDQDYGCATALIGSGMMDSGGSVSLSSSGTGSQPLD
jgi:hypothetical protein